MGKEVVKFYIPKATINEATIHYCKIIEKAFKKNGNEAQWITQPEDVKDRDIILSIRPGDLKKIKAKPKSIVSWFQGIAPEEYKLLHPNPLRSFPVSKYLERSEKKALKKSDLCIFVSQSMQKHYEWKYDLKLKTKSIVIPCYNIPLNLDSISNDRGRYSELNFVYAGGMFAWQCIDKTLLIFKEVYKRDDRAKLTLLTSQREKAEQLIDKYKVKNVEVDFVPLESLQKKLSNYKYGFLIRENHIVNNVATPTKMNSYLAAGLIPIYTDVVDSFEENIDLQEYSMKISNLEKIEGVADRIIKFHDETIINQSRLMKIYQSFFETYYNDEKYINALSKSLPH